MGLSPAAPGTWAALEPAAVPALLDGFAAPWWIAGGWALDLFAGRKLRTHADLDVVVLRRDQAALAAHLAEWDLHAAVGPGTLRPWRGAPLEAPVHEIWARPAADRPWACEFLLDDADGDRWLFRRDPRVGRPLSELGLDCGGVPVLVPEAALLFKAKEPDEKAESDFAAVLPLLGESARGWLGSAAATAHHGHEWLARL